MSSVEKLMIRGIRSFSPYNENVIEFYSPLTIIVGHNGAGKTTIIECLKYATTGDLPPNSKGGAFVHDPKVSREIEVKGQIKLKFRNAKGQAMVCTRSMQSTQKKSKLEQKTLESLLATTDPITGEQISISSRCAEMDAEIPFQLGVSKSVLENVLFCHQEDSFWPLSEPSVLKKKFDDIFAATRYTKALDTLKSIRKQMTADLKLEQQKLSFLSSDRDKADQVLDQQRKCKKRLEEGQERITFLDKEIESVNERCQELGEKIEKLSLIQSRIERSQHDLQMTIQNQKDLTASGMTLIAINDCSNEDLKMKLDDLEVSTNQNRIFELQRKKDQYETQIQDSSREFNELSTAQALILSERERMKRHIQDNLDNLKILFDSYGGVLSMEAKPLLENGELDYPTFQMHFERIKELFEENVKEYKSAQTSLDATKESFDRQQNELTGKKLALIEAKKEKKRNISQNQEKLCTLIEKLDNIASANSKLEQLERKCVEREGELELLQKSFDESNFEEAKADLQRQRKEMALEIQTLNNLQISLSKQTAIQAKLQVKISDCSSKKKTLEKLKSDLMSEIEDIDSVEDLYCRVKKDLQDAQNGHEVANRTLSFDKSKLEQAQALLHQKQKTFESGTEKLSLEFPKGFDEELESVKDALYASQQSLAHAYSSKECYEKFSQLFGESGDCPLCERHFPSLVDKKVFGRKLERLLSSLPEAVTSGEAEKRALCKKLEHMQSFQSLATECEKLKTSDIPLLIREIQEVSTQIDLDKANFEDATSKLASLKLSEKKLAISARRCDELKKISQEIAREENEIDSIKKEIHTLLPKNSQFQSSPLPGTLEEIFEKIKSLTDAFNAFQQQMDDLVQAHREEERSLQRAQSALRDTKEQMMSLRLLQSEASTLKDSQTSLEACISTNESECTEIDRETILLAERLSALLQKRQEHIESMNNKLDALNTQITSNQQSIKEIERVQGLIATSADACSLEKIEKIEENIREISEKLSDTQNKLNSTIESLNECGREGAQIAAQSRNIKDNLLYRELDERIIGFKRTLAAEQSALGTATLDKAALQAELDALKKKHSDFLGERSGLNGEGRQLQSQLSLLALEVERDYANIKQDYRQQFVKFNAISTATTDLELYARALDQAIMKFHSQKMAEINRIIKELWTSTYQGADIDTLEIRADHNSNSNSTAGSNTGARTYNYRVVMIKNGSCELDMRGRSSAGQRVLASLIIRLALAETFSQHCGIIALDEPTTNLDRDNIDSLAASLAAIIRERALGGGGKFQLIIITHDEEFVELLGRHDCADWYWRVGKDDDQYSCIERQSFNQLLHNHHR